MPSRSSEKSEKQLKREAKKQEKKAKKETHKAAAGGGQENNAAEADDKDDGPDVSEGKYGVLKMIQSREKPTDRRLIDVGVLSAKLNNQDVWVRARLHTSRAKGNSKPISM